MDQELAPGWHCLSDTCNWAPPSQLPQQARHYTPCPLLPGRSSRAPPSMNGNRLFWLLKQKGLQSSLTLPTQPSQIQSRWIKINTQEKPRLLPLRNTLSSSPPAMATSSCSPACIAGEASVWSPCSGTILPAAPAQVPNGPFIMKVRICPFFA